jgi:hypothetical protein
LALVEFAAKNDQDPFIEAAGHTFPGVENMALAPS